MDKTVQRWRALVSLGNPPKAIDLGVFEQLWGERLDELEQQAQQAGPLQGVEPEKLGELAGGSLAMVRAAAQIEVEPGCFYFGGPTEGEPSKGHTVTLRRHLEFWYGDPDWTRRYLASITTPPPAQRDYAGRIERAPFEEYAYMALQEARADPSLGGEELNQLERHFTRRWPTMELGYVRRLLQVQTQAEAERVLQKAEEHPSRSRGENEGLRKLFRDRWERPSVWSNSK